jgi:acyl dehydratase
MTNRVVVAVGDSIPEWVMENVRPERMRVTSAIHRDPNPVHWDPESTRSRGLDGRVINQGPLNVSYLVNMLMAWRGPTCVRRITVEFAGRLYDGDRVTARGVVTAVDTTADTATCDVWLERPDGTRPVLGTAVVSLNRTGASSGHQEEPSG